MKTYRYEQYRIRLEGTGRTDKIYGKAIIRYCLYTGNYGTASQDTIFSGEDLCASPMHAPESRQTAGAVLSFATWESEDNTPQSDRHAAFIRDEAEALYCWQDQLDAPEKTR